MFLDTTKALVPPAPAMCIDKAALHRFLVASVPAFPANESAVEVFQFSHGQSNPTYLVKAGSQAYVLRKKPPGKVLPSAHAVEREFKVLQALQYTAVPVPRTVALCEDPGVLGTPFYVMGHVRGVIHADPSLPGLDPPQRRKVYQGMAAALAALHSVSPGAVGLEGYGKPAGYNRRQVWRWGRQYMQSVQGEPMPEMLGLMRWLEGNIPATDEEPDTAAINHGDFRLDNLVMSESQPGTVLAVLDWELSTLGDPLADLAYNCLPYHLPSSIPSLPSLPHPLPPGIPTEQQYIKMYCQERGLPYPLKANWSFYLALSIFRLCSILAGVGARAAQGNASSQIAGQVGADSVVRELALAALRIADVALAPAVGRPTRSTTSPASTPPPGGAGSAPPSPPRISEETAEGGVTGAGGELLREGFAVVGSGSEPLPVGPSTAPTLGLGPSPRVKPILQLLEAFMEQHIYPAEAALSSQAHSPQRWTIHPLQEQLKGEAKRQGLWNLWIPADMRARLGPLMEALGVERGERSLLLGPGLTNLEYAHCAEVMGRSLWAPECFNCSAPDTGNMEVLARYGSLPQQQRWLAPLLRGDIRSAFAMTEPAVASSDATNIQASIRREGGEYVLNGRKWWISGAPDPRCQVAIFMGKSDPQGPPHAQQSMVVVPMDIPGVKVIRPLPVFGFDDAPHGHAEVHFENVRVPLANMILGEGRGFEIAQGRLGPGRLHHCMRTLGAAERALQLLVKRAGERTAFGSKLYRHQSVRLDIARSRLELDAARLVVLEAARALDEVGNKAARGQIAAAKALAPSAALRIIDRAIQVYGGAGVTDVTPLAHMWAGIRTLRLADGPDVVHLETIAKMELRRAKL